MHRYSVAAGGSGVGNNSSSSRGDSSRSDSGYVPVNFGAQSARRAVQLTPYKLRCDKEPLSPRLGPPDFYPPATDCAEELLTREACQNGYKESIEGIEEAKETHLTLISDNRYWGKDNISRYKESLRKRLRAVTSALVRKRKAGQVYDIPLGGALIAKPGYFPERHTCGEDFRRKWLEDLSQRKRLSLLADHVPHGFHRRTLFEALVKQNIPFLRATWLIKVLYLNQVRPSLAGSTVAGGDKSQIKRLEQWTRDFLDYAQSVLDDVCLNGSGRSQTHDDADELDGHAKWHYIVRLIQWQHTEGLLQQSHLVDWALKQIQDKDSLDALELLLPVVLEFLEALSLSQVHVRAVVDICLYWLKRLGVSNVLPNPDEQPQQYHIVVTLVEVLRYLLVAVPDTFVAFDCFPLLPCISNLEGVEPVKETDAKQIGVESLKGNNRLFEASPYREVFIMEAVDSIQKRASSLSKAVNPGILRNNEGKVIQGLDKWLASGDVQNAYQTVFDSDFSGYDQLPSEWKNSNASLPFLSGILNNVNLSDLFAVRFLCEWAICDFRDTRNPSGRKSPTSIRVMSRIYMTGSILSMRKAELEATTGYNSKKTRNEGTPDKFREKRCPMHEIIVAWIDQHELRKGESMEKMQLLLYELVRKGIFHPDAYVRQLIVEGLLERRESQSDITRAARHRRVLRYLPSVSVDDLKDGDEVSENERLYRNERRLALQSSSSEEKVAALKEHSAKMLRTQSGTQGKQKLLKLVEVKQAVCAYLHIVDGQPKPAVAVAASGNVNKRASVAIGDGHSCEECSRSKRQKTGERSWSGPGALAVQEPDDTWWSKKVTKVSDPVKPEASVKPPKQVRGRPKAARKTQSLAQLHNPRTDGSQAASSSLSFESRTQCPYHRSVSGNQQFDMKVRNDLRLIGSALKQLTISERYSFSAWLDRVLRKALGEAAPAMQGKAGTASTRWQLSDDQFGAVVYMLDKVLDYRTLVRFLLWLLPLSGVSSGSGRTVLNRSSSGVCESAVLSSLKRYEIAITSLNLLPDVLFSGMHCASMVTGAISSGKSPVLVYVSELFSKYKGVKTVQSWHRSWKVSCDPKLVSELESLKAGESESGMGFMGISNSVAEDRDDPIPQRLNSRLARIGVSIKDNVQKGLGEAATFILSRERDPHAPGFAGTDKVDECMHRVVVGLLDVIKQYATTTTTAQTDSGLINAAVSAIVSCASSSAASAYEALNSAGSAGSPDSLPARCARRILQLHVRCLCFLKEGLDERQSRILEVSLASEAAAIVAGHLVHTTGRAPRSQFHLSPETPELGALANDFAGQNLTTVGRAAAASALLVMVVLQGAVSLDRLSTVLKIREGLETLHLPKIHFGASNGLSRGSSLASNLKSDSSVEAQIYWYRTLFGNCKRVAGGLVADFLGDANLQGLVRTQRLLALNSVFPSAYSMFSGLLRRQVLSRMNIASRDDGILHSLTAAVSDIIKHEPFREVCLQDTRALNVLLSSDGGTQDYAALLDDQDLDLRSKMEAILPSSARLFLHALLDKTVPSIMLGQEDEEWMVAQAVYDQKRQVEQMVRILDELQPATFHWQWLELRLLLNEQVFVEKLEAPSTAVMALQASVMVSEPLSECEKVFTGNILTGLLRRPDAGALYSEVLHCLGKPLEEYVIKLVKWALQGPDVLFGRKSLRQRLERNKGSSKGTSGMKSWAWQPPGGAAEVASPEEGEVSENTTVRGVSSRDDANCLSHHFAIEKALADLVLPCLARSVNETCSTFASDLVHQMTTLDQQVTVWTRSAGKLPTTTAVTDGSSVKGQGSRRGARSGLEGGSPGVSRRPVTDASSVSAAALQSSMWLRLQFLLPLLRIIYCDREASARNMRLTLAPVLLRLLGTRIVQESAESHQEQGMGSREGQWNAELASMAAAAAAGEELFDRLLSVLHALLSNTWAAWLKPRGRAAKPPREVPPFDREVADRMQNELDHMQLSRSLRMRLQAAMPVFPPGPTFTLSAAPPQVASSSFSTLQSNLSSLQGSQYSQKASDLKAKSSPSLDGDTPMDPWLLLEDGTGLPISSSSGNDGGTLKACPWLKGAVRVRRTDLTYAGSVESDT